jgi:hypothetical protein
VRSFGGIPPGQAVIAEITIISVCFPRGKIFTWENICPVREVRKGIF